MNLKFERSTKTTQHWCFTEKGFSQHLDVFGIGLETTLGLKLIVWNILCLTWAKGPR